MLTAVQPFAVNNFGDTREGSLMGPMGLFVILSLVVATVLLIRNMNTHLRRVPDRFPGESPEQDQTAPDDLRELDADGAPVERTAEERARDHGDPRT